MLVVMKVEFPDVGERAGGVEDFGLGGMTGGLEDEFREARRWVGVSPFDVNEEGGVTPFEGQGAGDGLGDGVEVVGFAEAFDAECFGRCGKGQDEGAVEGLRIGDNIRSHAGLRAWALASEYAEPESRYQERD